jgi:glutamyl-Q tRNA(Asp) synthetase
MHGLHWDDEVIMQSERTTLYHHALTQLTGRGLIYACDCTRAKLRELGGIYTGFCRERQLKDDNTALRIRNTHHHAQFQDGLMGSLQNEYKSPEDFIIKRKDGFFAYHLAMVVDDWEQGITEVVRGVDLIQPTFNQLSLHQALGHSAPTHVHLPVAVNEKGQKLSKQNRAPVLDDRHASSNLIHALYFLEQQPPAELSGESTETILQWATQHWCLKAVPPVEKKSALC